MSTGDIKLCCELPGHTLDVRSVAVGSNNVIISGSRDKTAKIWAPQSNGCYLNTDTLKDHSNFISSVCVIGEGSNQLFVTGSNDNTICVYQNGNVTPLTLKGHSGTVCSLAPGPFPHSILSGSWDNSARLWVLSPTGEATTHIEYRGHEAAVWAVVTLQGDSWAGNIATGSADKTIALWTNNGKRVAQLQGHTDCVRGLASWAGGLLSCANDATIRQWNFFGICVRIYHGHTNYIYSIAVQPMLSTFITGGEDSTVRVWKLSPTDTVNSAVVEETDSCIAVVTIPCQSVWTVASLNNEDIVTGSSDGYVRIFSKDPSRHTSDALQCVFENDVKKHLDSTSQRIGDVKVADLPGPEGLVRPGTKDGQTKLIREGGSVICYQWINDQWDKVGDVMGASGSNQEPSKKTTYDGKDYDFVFSVDIEDGAPPLKLPYNRGEDPWVSAQTFIHKNNLPQVYLDQVANFIVKNSHDAPVIQQSSGYVDPFTGGSRYVPGSARGVPTPNSLNMDPFTGSTSYVSQSKGAAANIPENDLNEGGSSYNSHQTKSTNSVIIPQKEKLIPFTSYITFNQANRDIILEKLKNFNRNTGDGNHHVKEEILDKMIKLGDGCSSVPDVESIQALQQLLEWPIEIRFPVLDVTRLAVRFSPVFISLFDAQTQSQYWPSLLACIGPEHAIPANKIMALRVINNCMVHPEGRKALLPTGIVNMALGHVDNISEGSVALQLVIATLLLNLSVAIKEWNSRELCASLYCSTTNALTWITDPESVYRLLLALGTQATNEEASNIINEMKQNKHLQEMYMKILAGESGLNLEKLVQCAKELVDLLS